MKRQLRPVTQLLLVGAFHIFASVAWGQSEPVWIPLKSVSGKPEMRLEAALYRPVGKGPFPVVIFSHGSTGPGMIPATQTLRPDGMAKVFMRHGFAVIAPMRRGRGASDGTYDEPYGCDSGPARHGVKNAIADTDAVVAFVKTLPFLDSSHILLSGISRGGFLSIVYAAERPAGVVGVVNFVGGWQGDVCRGNFNAESFSQAGAAVKVPTLWLYAENDPFYSAPSIRKFAQAFQKAGGNQVFRLYPPLAESGHSLPKYFRVWQADFEEFMKKLGFPVQAETGKPANQAGQ